MAIKATTIPTADPNKRIVVIPDSGKMKAIIVKDKIVEIDISGLTGSGISKLGFYSTWSEFNAGMTDSKNHGKLFYVEDMDGRDDIPSGESGIVYMANGTDYFLERSWIKTKQYIDTELAKKISTTDADAKYFTKAEALVELPKKLDESKFNTEIAKHYSKTEIDTKIATATKAANFRGTFADTAARDTAITSPAKGDYVLVGAAAPYQEYIYDTSWEAAGKATSSTSLSPAQTAAIATIASKADKTYVDTELAKKVDTTTLASYDTTAQVNAKLRTKMDETNAYTKTQADGKFELKTDAATNLALKADKSTTYTKVQADGKFELKTDATTKLNLKADKATTYTKTDADAQFETKAHATATFETKADLTTKLAAKQDTLTKTITITYDDGTTETVKVG